MYISLYISLSLHIYIYIHIEREREIHNIIDQFTPAYANVGWHMPITARVRTMLPEIPAHISIASSCQMCNPFHMTISSYMCIYIYIYMYIHIYIYIYIYICTHVITQVRWQLSARACI